MTIPETHQDEIRDQRRVHAEHSQDGVQLVVSSRRFPIFLTITAAVLCMALIASWIYLLPRVHVTAEEPVTEGQFSNQRPTAVLSEALLTRDLKFIGTYSSMRVRDAGVTGVVTHAGGTGSEAVALELAGRPLVGVQLAFPLYRDIKPGDSGRDVAEIRRAISALGFKCGDKNVKKFGPGLQGCLRVAYKSWGYEPPLMTQEEPNVSQGGAVAEDSTAGGEAEAKPPMRVSVPYVAKSEWLRLLPGESVDRDSLQVGDELGPDRQLKITTPQSTITVQDDGAFAKHDVIGAKMEIASFAEPNEVREATLEEVRQAEGKTSILVSADSAIPDGEVSGRIILESTKTPVPVAPLEAVHFGPGGKRFVLVYDDDEAGGKKLVEKDVELGDESGGMVHIVDGPPVGTVLVLGE